MRSIQVLVVCAFFVVGCGDDKNTSTPEAAETPAAINNTPIPQAEDSQAEDSQAEASVAAETAVAESAAAVPTAEADVEVEAAVVEQGDDSVEDEALNVEPNLTSMLVQMQQKIDKKISEASARQRAALFHLYYQELLDPEEEQAAEEYRKRLREQRRFGGKSKLRFDMLTTNYDTSVPRIMPVDTSAGSSQDEPAVYRIIPVGTVGKPVHYYKVRSL